MKQRISRARRWCWPADLVFNSRKGKKETQWVTDSTWKSIRAELPPGYLMWPSFGGELYDAAKELEGWSSPELDDSSWKAVKVYTPGIQVSANRVEGNRLIGTLKPVSVESLIRVGEDRYGLQLYGVLRFKMKGAAGAGQYALVGAAG
jgi:alpha-L-rhamnosidase